MTYHVLEKKYMNSKQKNTKYLKKKLLIKKSILITYNYITPSQDSIKIN